MRKMISFIFLILVSLGCSSAVTGTEKYYQDRCRSAFDENLEAKADADRAKPLVMAIFGDSIVWGQGLKERDKFWCRTKQWLELKTRRHVAHKVYAHAGAIIDEASLEKNDFELLVKVDPQGEEVNLSFPTIPQQVETAALEYRKAGKDVDLVLIDGCINDVNFRNLLNAERTIKDIEDRTWERCGKPMELLLTRLTAEFPKAYVIVTGYYPIIYKGLKVEEDGKKKTVVKGSANNQLTRTAFKTLGSKNVPPRCAEDMRDCLDPLSRAWYATSNRVLKAAVDTVKRDKGAHIYFAEMNFPPEYGFSTKQSMLWNIRFGATNLGGLRKWVAVGLDLFRIIDTNDDRWDERGKQCRTAKQAFNDRFKELVRTDALTPEQKSSVKERLRYFEFVCRRGSLGHPNRFGVALYTQTVVGQLQAIISDTGWMTPDAAR